MQENSKRSIYSHAQNSSKIQAQVYKISNINPDTGKPDRKVRLSGNCIENIDTGDNFMNKTSIAQALRSTINKWDLIKLKVSI